MVREKFSVYLHNGMFLMTLLFQKRKVVLTPYGSYPEQYMVEQMKMKTYTDIRTIIIY